jgi:hypothetical protein
MSSAIVARTSPRLAKDARPFGKLRAGNGAPTFACRDLISTRDLGSAGVEAVLNLAGVMKARAADFRRALA